jgi:hypothetical protein
VSDQPPAYRPSPYVDAASLRLGQLQPGQVRLLRLPLMEIRRFDKRPTDFFLDLTITCRDPEHSYRLEVRPEFGPRPPTHAVLTVLEGRCDAAPPVALVQAGRPQEPCLELTLQAERPGSGWLTLWVAAEGAPDVPAQLAGEVRIRSGADDRREDELETARLPSLQTVVRQSLMGAFRRAASPSLVLLGGLMRSEDPEEKFSLLQQLVELGSGIALVEAGAREIAAGQQSVREFPPVDFAKLEPSDPVHAALAIFHPGSPARVVLRAFASAFDGQFRAKNPAAAQRWTELARAAALVLCRRDRALLDEGLTPLGTTSHPARQAKVRALVEWAAQRAASNVKPPPRPMEEYLRTIAGDDAAAAEAAAVSVMTRYELLTVAPNLDD